MRYSFKIRLNYVFSTLDIIPSEFYYTLVCVTFGIPVGTQTGSGIIAMVVSSETPFNVADLYDLNLLAPKSEVEIWRKPLE